VLISGRAQDRCERDDVGIIDHDEFVQVFGLPEVLELVNHNVHHRSSRFFVELLVEPGC
jgi:hypothetical protein